ncbi:unnamed protein product [Soboliphyme baturini]|uniref:Uncharacterized protein n=1 Tax=Soboliphyme baturini TaxID=241478 RepID=A0A183IZZ8_9BILA|nr:unnamed protein product [Soboliphyme baturini]
MGCVAGKPANNGRHASGSTIDSSHCKRRSGRRSPFRSAGKQQRWSASGSDRKVAVDRDPAEALVVNLTPDASPQLASPPAATNSSKLKQGLQTANGKFW